MSLVDNRKYVKYSSSLPVEVGEVDLSATELRTHGSRTQSSRVQATAESRI